MARKWDEVVQYTTPYTPTCMLLKCSQTAEDGAVEYAGLATTCRANPDPASAEWCVEILFTLDITAGS